MSADAPADLDQSVRAALLRHPGAVIVGTTAAVLLGAAGEPGGPVELALAGGARPAPGLLLRRDRLDADEIGELDGIRLTTPVRTAFDVGRRSSTVDAVVVAEALARGQGVTVEGVREIAARHPHERGLVRLRTALEHVEPGARAGIETPVRMALVAAGLPRPTVGHVVVDAASGLPLGVTDLAWPELRCALLCERDDDTAWTMTGLLPSFGWVVELVDRERFTAGRELMIEGAEHLLRRRRRELRSPDDTWAEIIAAWPSRARRRTVTPRLYS